MKSNVISRSANVARVLLDGQEVGLCQNVRMSDSYGHEPLSGIGDIHVAEHAPTLARHSISVGHMALRSTSLYKLGIIPENGEDVLQGNVFDIEVFDKATNEVLRKYLTCSYDSGDIEVTRNAIIGYNCQFMATDVAGKM
jgi:hypothetical protein